jgi:hypothetical protein
MPVDSHIMHKVMDEQDLKKKNLLFNAIFVWLIFFPYIQFTLVNIFLRNMLYQSKYKVW